MQVTKQITVSVSAIIFIVLCILLGSSCTSGTQTSADSANTSSLDLKKKELELKEKELELKARELELRNKPANGSEEKAAGPSQNQTENSKTPKWVVEQIFIAAKTRNFHLLDNLCDPQGQGDGETRDLCSLSSHGNPDHEDGFVTNFEFGRVSGEAEISGNQAIVPIKFGPNGDKAETFRLVKRGDRWYLSSI